MTVLEKIDKLRIERGWSINYLAMEAMLTQSTLNNLYMRNAEPKISTLRAICNAFGITLAEFFADEGMTDKSDIDLEIQRKISTLTNEQKSALIVILKSMK
ncbi:MAG: helix-turn-helix domain-containing protein [Clostridia bacterium]|nr:helix-turn-helix domain-containing protein [Clostridia bacterium]